MSCICEKDETRLHGDGTTPYKQCPKCAKKHIVASWTAWQELGHERDNRDYCSGQLRLASEHLAEINPDLAMKCHDCAIRIEDFDDSDGDRPILEDINAVRLAIWDMMPEQEDDNLPPIDLIIPFKEDESWRGQSDELKILLRSLDKNAKGLGRVCVVSETMPDWVNPRAKGLVWLPQGNPYQHNKDANLFLKMEKAISFLGIGGKWMFSADDAALLQPFDLRKMPIVYNGRKQASFEAASSESKWSRRMVNTFDYLKGRNIAMSYSYDCHIPQAFNATTITALLQDVPYQDGAGFCIYTLWRGLEGKTSGDTQQDEIATYYNAPADAEKRPLEKTFCNWNDSAFGAGLREKLFQLFPEKSHFEL